MKVPGPDHPITIDPHPGKVRVLVRGVPVVETTRALSLQEASYDPVLYVPREDARFDLFSKNPRTTHCPYKGDASYYDVAVDGDTRQAAVWSYENPFPAVAEIKGHLAFYKDKVDAIEEEPA